MHHGAGHNEGTLVDGLMERFSDLAVLADQMAASGSGDPTRPGIVHRLDKGTSGLMVVARTEARGRVLVRTASDQAGRSRVPGARAREHSYTMQAWWTQRSAGRTGWRRGWLSRPRVVRLAPLTASSSASRARRIAASSKRSSRPAGRIRSGCTWLRSAIRWVATTGMAKGLATAGHRRGR